MGIDSIRSRGSAPLAPGGVSEEVEAPRLPEAPAADPTDRQVDRTETSADARLRNAEAAVTATAQPPLVNPTGVSTEIRTGIATRTDTLERTTRQVDAMEGDLRRMISERGPALTEEQRGEQVRAFRERPENATRYQAAEHAAQDLSGYLAQNTARLDQSVREMPAIFRPDAQAAAGSDLRRAQEALSNAYVHSPEAATHLQRNLGLAASGVGTGLGQGSQALSGGFAQLASRASGAFGALSSGLSLAGSLQRLQGPGANGYTAAAAAAQGTSVALGLARLGGFALATGSVASGVGIAAGAVSMAAGAMSQVAERNRTRDDAARTLRDAGQDPAVADGVGQAHPRTLQALRDGGLSPEQIQQLARTSPSAIALPAEYARQFLGVAQRAGLNPDEIHGLLGTAAANGPHGAMMLMQRVGEAGASGFGADRATLLRQLAVAQPGYSQDELRPAIDYLRSLPIRG